MYKYLFHETKYTPSTIVCSIPTDLLVDRSSNIVLYSGVYLVLEYVHAFCTPSTMYLTCYLDDISIDVYVKSPNLTECFESHYLVQHHQ